MLAFTFRGLAVAIFGLAIVVSSTPAAPKKPQGTSQNSAASGLVAQLHHAHHLLKIANHDYKGHRANAMHQIHLAIKTVKAATKGKGKGKGKAHAKSTAKVPAIHESQAASDNQLRQALGILQGLRVPAAIQGNITTAIAEIQTALAVSPANNANRKK